MKVLAVTVKYTKQLAKLQNPNKCFENAVMKDGKGIINLYLPDIRIDFLVGLTKFGIHKIYAYFGLPFLCLFICSFFQKTNEDQCLKCYCKYFAISTPMF